MPTSIEAKLLLPTKLVGSAVICKEIRRVLDLSDCNIEPLLKVNLIAGIDTLLASHQMTTPIANQFFIKKVGNVAKSQYISTSPLLGVVSEFLYQGSSPWHFPLVKRFIEAYFAVIDGYQVYTDSDYYLWRSAKLKEILGRYQSSLNRCAKRLRDLLRVDAGEFNSSLDKFLLNPPKDYEDHLNSLKRLELYADGAPSLAHCSKYLTPEKSHIVIEHEGFSTECTFEINDDGFEPLSQSVSLKIPNYINSQKQYIAHRLHLKGIAAKQARRNQLRVTSDDILRPTAWCFLDGLLLDQSVEIETRQLIALSLLHGQTLEKSLSDFQNLFPTAGIFVLQLNAPKAKSGLGISIKNKLQIAIPNRYKLLFMNKPPVHPVLSTAKKAIKSLEKSLNVTPLKISRLFFFMAEKLIGKSRASLLFNTILTTINAQLHYTVVCHQRLIEAYSDVWNDFESVLPNPLGIDYSPILKAQDEVAGINNMPLPSDIATDIARLSGFAKNTVKAFLLFASEHSSRGTFNQKPAVALEYLSQKTLGIVNDKQRNGQQHARLALYRNGTLTEVKEMLGLPVKSITSIRFQFFEGGRLIQLSPAFFKSPNNINFPMNAIRKLRHSYLLNLDINEEVIDALYGHYAIGTVTLSAQGSLSIADIELAVATPSALFTLMLLELIDD